MKVIQKCACLINIHIYTLYIIKISYTNFVDKKSVCNYVRKSVCIILK